MSCPSSQQTTVLRDPEEYFLLSQSITHGDLQGVKDFLNQRPDAITAWINIFETPLLKACHYGQLEIVKELLQRMSPEQIMIPWPTDGIPTVPLTIAAGNGNFEMVVALFEKNSEQLVPTHPGYLGRKIPVLMASTYGHREITRYLYERTPLHVFMDNNGHWARRLLLDAIFYGMFDIAFAIFDQSPSIIAVTNNRENLINPFVFLAMKSDLFIRGSHLGFWGRMVYSYLELPTDLQTTSLNSLFGMFLQCLPKWFGIQRIYELKERDDKAHEFLCEVCRYMSLMVQDKNWRDITHRAVYEAVKNGNKQFIIEIVKRIPHVLAVYLGTKRSMFHLAVQYRKEMIFNLFYGLDERKINILRGKDEDHNNILHIAAHLPNKEELSKAAGAALKMQRELQWFKEVESLMHKRKINDVNNKGKTPRQVFEESHEPLRKEAEEWMKYTATACSFVAALIATVTFQAIFTVPGGNDDMLGDPIYLKDSRFTLFIISDTISFFASCTSVLIFLSILTARYSFDDFLVSLPRKMILGLTILFVSIAAMLVAFSSALFVSLRQKPLLVIPVMPLACLPGLLFLMLQYPLLKEMISSTYGKGLFDRDTKHWF